MTSAVEKPARLLNRLTRRDKSFLTKAPDQNQMLLQPIKMPSGRRERELFEKQISLRVNLPVMNKKETSK